MNVHRPLALLACAAAAAVVVTAPSTAAVDGGFDGHAFRVVGQCSGGERVAGRVGPVTTRRGDLMVATFRLTGAEPGSHWTFSTVMEGGGVVGNGDGELTVDEEGRAEFGAVGGAAHVRQQIEVIADKDATGLPGDPGSRCRLQMRARY